MQATFDSPPVEPSPPLADIDVEQAPRSWLGTLYTWSLVVLTLLTGAFLCVVVGGVAALLGDRHRRVAHAMLAFGYRNIERLHPLATLELTGVENLPAGPCVLCPNHQSYSDVVFLYWLPLHFKWVIKKELFRVPVFGAAMRVAGYPKVDRGDPASAARLMAEVARHLEGGVPVLSFPEGTRSADGRLGRLQSGTARMALASGVPLVPIGVVGTANVLPRGRAMYPAHLRLAIHIGPPIPTAGRSAREVRALTRELRAAIVEARRVAMVSMGGNSRVDGGSGLS